MKKINCLVLLIVIGSSTLCAQKSHRLQNKYLHDSAYYEMFPDHLTGRIYVSKKFEDINVPSGTSAPDIKYVANHKMNFGIGVTWHNFSISAFYGFNNSNSDKGKTKGLDIQLHMFPHKWAIDVLAVMPKGMRS